MAIVKRKGEKNWNWVTKGPDGKQVWKSLGTPYKEEAKRLVHELELQRWRVRQGLERERRQIPWEDLVKEYLQKSRGDGNRGPTTERKQYGLANSWRFMPRSLASDWTAPKLEEYKRFRLDEHGEPTTVNLELRYIRGALRLGRRNGYITASADELSDVRRIQELEKQRAVLGPSTIRTVVAIADRFWTIVVLLGALQGLRRGEILRLQWPELNFDRGLIKIINYPGAPTKTGRNETIPTHDAVRAALLEWRKINGTQGAVVPRDGDANSLGKAFSREMKRLGFPGITLHSLRRSFATNLELKDVSGFKRDRLMRHMKKGVADLYPQIKLDDLRESINRLDDPFTPEAPPPSQNGKGDGLNAI